MKEERSHFPINSRNRIFYFLAQIILCNFKTSSSNVALEKKIVEQKKKKPAFLAQTGFSHKDMLTMCTIELGKH